LLAGAARGLGLLPGPWAAKLARAAALAGEEAGAYWAERGLFSPAEVRRLLEPELAAAVEGWDPRLELRERLRLEDVAPEERVSALELRRFLQVQLLRDTDAMGMRHSLEIRTPLVDRDLLRAVARVPVGLRFAGPAKRWLREAPRPPLPEALWDRPKRGFTPPFDRWLRSGSLPVELAGLPGFRGEEVERVVRGFRRGAVRWSRLWALMVIAHFS
jgi:asparagine synthase (glutamine-hydrolysing)